MPSPDTTDRILKRLYHHLSVKVPIHQLRRKGWFDFQNHDHPDTSNPVDLACAAFVYLSLEGDGNWNGSTDILIAVLSYLKEATDYAASETQGRILAVLLREHPVRSAASKIGLSKFSSKQYSLLVFYSCLPMHIPGGHFYGFKTIAKERKNDLIETLAEFDKQLAQGRGGVALYLQQNLPLPDEYRDALLYACLHDLRYDYQVEDTRSFYLFTLIELTGDSDFYREHIFAAIPEINDENFHQLMTFLCLFAEREDSEARSLLYTTFEKQAKTAKEISGGDLLVSLDGVDGLMFLVDRYADEEIGYSLSDFDFLLDDPETREGKAIVHQRIEHLCTENALRLAWWKALKTYREEKGQPRPQAPKRTTLTYEEFRALIKRQGGKRSGHWWSKNATDEERLRAAKDLLLETDPDVLPSLLQVFSRVPFPLDPAPLIPLATSNDENIAWQTQCLLANLKSPTIRAFTLQLLMPPRPPVFSLDLLTRNYRSGDEQIALDILQSVTDSDRNTRHRVCFETEEFITAHPSDLSVTIAILIYETTPCSCCRGRAIKILVALNALPKWIREEAKFDTDETTRELVTE